MWRTRSSSKTMMYLAAASALYAWRTYNRTGSAAMPTRSAPPAPESNTGAGITDLPPNAEREQQESLPPRGQRKSDYHA